MKLEESAHPGSVLIHAPIALAIQVVGWALIGIHIIPALWVCGLLAMVTLFMREDTQYEYQYIQVHGGLRANMPPLEGLKFWKWDSHSKRETAVAALAVLIFSTVMTFILR